MNGTILGIGPLEFIIIVVLVMLVLGPERLPDLMRQAGKSVRRLREFYVNFSKDLSTELRPFQDEIKILQDVTDELKRDLAVIREAADIRTAIAPIPLDGSKPAAAGAAATKSAAAASATKPAATAATPAPEAVSTAPAAGAPPRYQPSSNGSGLDLGNDNPWNQLASAARTDALDKDNPWAL